MHIDSENKQTDLKCSRWSISAHYRVDDLSFSETKWKKGPLFSRHLPLHKSVEQLEVWDGYVSIQEKTRKQKSFFINFEDIDGFLYVLLVFRNDNAKKAIFYYNVGSGTIEFVRNESDQVNLTFYQEPDSVLLYLENISFDEIIKVIEQLLMHLNKEFLQLPKP